MKAHRRRLFQVAPDLQYVMKYTDQGPYPGNHWFWKDGRKNHGHDRYGQAYVRWKVRPSAASGYQTHGEFNVVRLLVEARVGALPARSRYVSVCGLSQCINPDHWRCADPAVPWRMQVLESGVWQLVRVINDAPAAREVVVHARLGDVVHIVAIAPLAQRSLAPPLAVCGEALPPAMLVVTAAAPTCSGCG